ncbi:MAG: AAA family ATPase [Mariprofundus sp.]
MNVKVLAEIIREETGMQLRGALSRVENITLSMHLPADAESLRQLGSREMPDILIIELDNEADGQLELIEKVVSKNRGKLTTYIIYQSCTSETMRILMKAGVKDFFPLPLQSQELIISVIDVMSAKREKVDTASKRGGMVAFLDSKGGGGASTVAMNVAHTLATKHKAQTALIDFDIQFGTAALSLDLHPHASLMDAMVDIDRIDPVFIKALMSKHKSGLEVLAAPEQIEPINIITVEGVARLLDAMSQNYEFVIMDMPRVFTDWVVKALQMADPLMLVVHHDLDSIRDAKLILDTLPTMEIADDRVEIINNRAMTTVEESGIAQIKSTLKKEHIHRVSNDYKTAIHAAENGLPLIEVSKRSALTADVLNLAGYLVEMHRGKADGKQTLMGRLFGGK